MAAGIRACGDRPEFHWEHEYPALEARGHLPDIALFYGLEGQLPLIFRDYAAKRWAVYVDLGYWGRREGGRWTGFHKVVVNARHPVAYFRKPQHDRKRIHHFSGLLAQPWTLTGNHILLAGMGDKGALAEGFEPEQWERQAIDILQAATDRPILYRPKPSWKTAKPIPGTLYSDPAKRVVEDELQNCWAVVTHHSNVAVDALVAGVPTFCWGGVAADLSSQKLHQIERPIYAEGRDGWMADIAYTQWSVAEMERGDCWRHLRTEGLV